LGHRQTSRARSAKQHFPPPGYRARPPGDAQPNPPDSEAAIRIRVYKHREDEELPEVAKLAVRYTQKRPDHTVAILVPTNNLGYQIAERLDELDADYDNLLRGGTREREIAAAMHAVLTVLADPLDTQGDHRPRTPACTPWGHPVALLPDEELEQFRALLRSVYQPGGAALPARGRHQIAARRCRPAWPPKRTWPGWNGWPIFCAPTSICAPYPSTIWRWRWPIRSF
jgi:hypothetical protein